MSGLYHQEPNMQVEDPELPLTPGQLKALYPYQFSALGVTRPEFAAGWMPVVVSMCREVDALMRDRLDRYSFVWIQFKEKFGSARFAYQLRELCDESGDASESPETRELRQRLLEIRLKAEMQTRTLCMVCGQPAQLVDTPWMLTLCPEHEEVHRRGERLSAYLDDQGREVVMR